MGAAQLLIPELEEVIQHGSHQKRVETLQRITSLFLKGAGSYSDEHIDLFDAVFGRLIEEIESKAPAELSNLLAPVRNAPVRLLCQLARDDDIAVAGPVLTLAPRLPESDLIDLASAKSQEHLQAIAGREALGEAVTDVLVRRGDREVARSVAENRGARISESGFVRLVKRAETDGVLAEKVGLRPDMPQPLFHDLLTQTTAVVQKRLLAAATPAQKTEIRRVLEKISGEVGRRSGPRDYRAAQRVVLGLQRGGRMNEDALAAFARDNRYEETVVALASLVRVPVSVADRLMAGDRPDPVLILCKAAGLGWSTVKSVISVQPDGKAPSSHGLDYAFANYGRLSAPTAQRVVRF